MNRLTARWISESTGSAVVSVWGLVVFFLLLECSCGFAQSNLVLRDLEIPASKIKRFDKDAVYLEDGTVVDWDNVLQADLTAAGEANESVLEFQKRFDRFVRERGLPIFRIRHRLKIGDYGALPHLVNPLYESLVVSPDTSAGARLDYLICLGTLYARLHTGDRVGAIEPYLKAIDLRSRFSFESGLPAAIDVSAEPMELKITPKITPLFFDTESAMKQLPVVRQELSREGGAGVVYWTAIALCAGDQGLAEKGVGQLASRNSRWSRILAAQLELGNETGKRMEALKNGEWRKDISGPQAVVVDYLLGLAAKQVPTDADLACLTFLRVAAANEKLDRGVASAALYQAFLLAEENGRPGEAEIFKRELLDNYPETYHGRLMPAKR